MQSNSNISDLARHRDTDDLSSICLNLAAKENRENTPFIGPLKQSAQIGGKRFAKIAVQVKITTFLVSRYQTDDALIKNEIVKSMHR